MEKLYSKLPWITTVLPEMNSMNIHLVTLFARGNDTRTVNGHREQTIQSQFPVFLKFCFAEFFHKFGLLDRLNLNIIVIVTQ